MKTYAVPVVSQVRVDVIVDASSVADAIQKGRKHWVDTYGEDCEPVLGKYEQGTAFVDKDKVKEIERAPDPLKDPENEDALTFMRSVEGEE